MERAIWLATLSTMERSAPPSGKAGVFTQIKIIRDWLVASEILSQNINLFALRFFAPDPKALAHK